MSQNYQRGDLTGVVWIPQINAQPAGIEANQLGAATVLTVKDQDLDLSALLIDVTTVLAGGGTARLGGKNDASADIVAIYDADKSPYLAVPNIVQGAGGLLLFAITVGATRSLQVPMRIEKVHWTSGLEKAVAYSFTAKMDVRVGALVYPAA